MTTAWCQSRKGGGRTLVVVSSDSIGSGINKYLRERDRQSAVDHARWLVYWLGFKGMPAKVEVAQLDAPPKRWTRASVALPPITSPATPKALRPVSEGPVLPASFGASFAGLTYEGLVNVFNKLDPKVYMGAPSKPITQLRPRVEPTRNITIPPGATHAQMTMTGRDRGYSAHDVLAMMRGEWTRHRHEFPYELDWNGVQIMSWVGNGDDLEVRIRLPFWVTKAREV